MNRRDWGQALTLGALLALVLGYGLALLQPAGDRFGPWLRAMMTLVPLLLLLPFVWRRVPKAYQILALLAPWHFFVGGVIWLWGEPAAGAYFCLGALLLQTGTILHNYRPRPPRLRLPALVPLGANDLALLVSRDDARYRAWAEVWAGASYEGPGPGLGELLADDVWATAPAGVLRLEDRAGRNWFRLPLTPSQRQILTRQGRLLLLPLPKEAATPARAEALATRAADDDVALAHWLSAEGLEGLGLTFRPAESTAER